MLVATANAWAECYVVSDRDIELPYESRNANGTGTSKYVDFSNGYIVSFKYRIGEWAGGEHTLIVEGWDGSNWVQLLKENIQYQTSDKSFSANVEKYSQLKFTRKAYKGATSIDAGKKTIIISDIYISREITMDASVNPTEFSPTLLGEESESGQITVDYSNIGVTQVVSSTNTTDFTITPKQNNFESCVGTASYDVVFHPKGENGGVRSTTITIAGREQNSDKDKKYITITLTGVAVGVPVHSWLGTTEYYVDDVIDLSELTTTTNLDPSTPRVFSIIGFETDDNFGSEDPHFIDDAKTKVKLSKEGRISLQMSQAATDTYLAQTSQITLTIKKHEPQFTWTPSTVYWNQPYTDYFSTSNKDTEISIQEVAGQTDNQVAKLQFSSNTSDKHTLDLITYNKPSSTTIIVTQAENYYWAPKSVTRTITPTNPSNYVPFTVTENNDNEVFVKGSYYGYQWNNGLQVGDGGGGGNWNAKYVVIEFSGVPDKLSFEYETRGVFLDNTTQHDGIFWFVQESKINESWDDKEYIWSTNSGDNGSSPAIQLSPETRFIRIGYWGNFGTAFQNVHVSKREEFYASEVYTKNKIDTLNFDIDPNGDPKENQVGIPHSLSFDFHYANVGYDVKLSTNDTVHFTLSQTSFKNIGGEKVGKETITVTYLASEKYTAENKELYITDELGNKYTIALTASTVKATPTLTWQGVYAAEKPVVRISEGAISNLATASSGLQVTYRSSDESIVKVSEDSLSLIPLQMADTVEITAIQKGNNVWNEVKETKIFRITDKLTQLILWPNTLSDLVIGGENIALDAKVYVVNDETGEYTFSESLTSNLRYEVENTDVVAIEEGVLKIKGIGETYLTVTAPGNSEYAESSIRVYVRVRAKATGCEDYLLHHSYYDEELGYFQMNLNAIQYGPFEIDRIKGEPDYITLQHRGAAWGLNFGGSFEVYYETVESTQLQTATPRFSPEKDKTGTDTIDLPRNATKFYIKRLGGATGYHYLSNIQVHPAQYVETNVAEIDFGKIYVGSQVNQTFTVDYCNIKSEIYPQTSSADVQVSPSYFGGCNEYGSQSVTVKWTPSSIHNNEQTVTITDPVSDKSASVRIFANVLKGTQTLDWDAPAQIDACGQLVLPKETDEHIALDWTVVEGQQYADFEDGMLAIKGNGTITLRASNTGSENYNAFQKDYQITIVYNPIFLGTVDSDWTNPANWNVCNLPRETDKVTIQAPVVFDTPVSIGGLVVESNASIHIQSTGGLTVGVSGIVGAKEDGTSIFIDNTPEGAGFLKVNPETTNKPAKVTVNYTTKAYNSGNPRDEIWQYMGAPGRDMQMSDANKTMIYHWNEQQGWLKMSNTNLQPFVGYAFTQNKADSASFQIQVTPIIPEDIQEINLTVTASGMGGSNLFVNSFLAPIDLATFTGDEFVGEVDQTFYLFNSGSWKQWQNNGGANNKMSYGVSPGQYYALSPKGASLMDKEYDQTTIPSMQGVYVIAREDGAKIKLDYAKHVYAANASNQAMRAPERVSEDFKRVRLHVNSQNSGADRMYVIQHDLCTAGFDNGYDAHNMAVSGQVGIYTHEAEGQMEISVSDKIDSTYIGFRAGSDSEYTLRITSVVGEEMYLKDLVDDILIPVVDGQDYTFSATPNSVNDTRFLLLGQKSGVATDIEEVQVYIHDNMVHVMEAPENSSMSIYTVGGVTVANYSIGYAPCTIDLLGLPTGVYVLRINDKAYKFVCK